MKMSSQSKNEFIGFGNSFVADIDSADTKTPEDIEKLMKEAVSAYASFEKTGEIEEKVDFKKIIIENVEAFSLEKLEEITYSLAKKELKHIEVIGAILGGIIGIFQFAISLFV